MSAMLIDEGTKPVCPCCGGRGMHEIRRYVRPSDMDQDTECSLCTGSGHTWHDGRPLSCAAYRILSRRMGRS